MQRIHDRRMVAVASLRGVSGSSGWLPGAPNEQTKSVVPHLRRSTAWLVDPALPGWADFWCRPSGPGLQTPLSHVHSILNLPQASQLLPRHAPRQAGAGGAGGAKRDTKEEVPACHRSGCRTRGIFITLGALRSLSTMGARCRSCGRRRRIGPCVHWRAR